METFIIVLLISVSSCYGFPASGLQRSGRMTADSHPMLASVFNVVNAVRDIKQGASFASPNTPSFVGNQHPKNALPGPAKVAVHPGSTSKLQATKIGSQPNTNKEGQRGIVARLGDMQCSLCRQLQDIECIRRTCWVPMPNRPTVDLNTLTDARPPLHGQTLNVMNQVIKPGAALGVVDQPIMQGPALGMVNQNFRPDQALGTDNQPTIPEPALGILNHNVMPGQVLGTVDQPIMPGPTFDIVNQNIRHDQALGTVGQQMIPGSVVGGMHQGGIGPAGVETGGLAGHIQPRSEAVPVLDSWRPTVGGELPVVEPKLRNVVNPPPHVAPVPVAPVSNTAQPALFAVPVGLEALINRQAGLPSTVPVHQPSVLHQLNPASEGGASVNRLGIHGTLTNSLDSSAVPQVSVDTTMNQRQGLDLVRNTLVDHPLKAIPGGDSMFESHVDKIHDVHIGSQGSTNTADGNFIPFPQTNAQTNVGGPARVPVQMNQLSGQPLPDRPMTGHAGSNVRPSVPVANDIFGPVSPGLSSRPESPTVAVASDIFGSAGMAGAGAGDRHTLVLKQHRGGGEKVGIVIGDTDPNSRVLSVLETSGQIPASRSNTEQQPSVPRDSMFVPISTANLPNQQGMSHVARSNFGSAQASVDQGRMIPMSSIHSGGQSVLPGAPAMTSSIHSGGNPGRQSGLPGVAAGAPATMTLSVQSGGNPGGQSVFPGAAAGAPASMTSSISGENQAAFGNQDGMFPAGFIESVLSSTTPLPTMNPVRKAELQSWGSQFLPTNRRP